MDKTQLLKDTMKEICRARIQDPNQMFEDLPQWRGETLWDAYAIAEFQEDLTPGDQSVISRYFQIDAQRAVKLGKNLLHSVAHYSPDSSGRTQKLEDIQMIFDRAEFDIKAALQTAPNPSALLEKMAGALCEVRSLRRIWGYESENPGRGRTIDKLQNLSRHFGQQDYEAGATLQRKMYEVMGRGEPPIN